MENIICTIKAGLLREIPMEMRRKLAWLLSCPHFQYFMDAGMKFQLIENGVLYGEWNGIRIHVRDYSDAMSLFQFAYDYYDFSVMDKLEDITVLDIGSHVGVSTCFFSKHPCVNKVYSYEPFKENYEQLLLNLKLNPYTNDKASIENLGVNDQAAEEICPFYPKASLYSGITSSNVLNFMANLFDFSFNDVTCIFDDIMSIEAKLPANDPFMIFINAKGFEERVLRRLFNDIDTSRLKAVIGHFYYDFGIEQMLVENGFNFSFHSHTISMAQKKFGCFWATRR